LLSLLTQFEDPEKIKTRFGLILTAIMYCLFSLPVLGIIEAFKKKCTRHMPFPMIASGSLVGMAWLLHGIIINSGFVIVSSLPQPRQLAASTALSMFLLGPKRGYGHA
jgi:RsiW-degrading membrane proteinase PrsW (M82 family)